MKIDFDELTELRNEWFSLFDELVALIESNNGCVMVNTPIFDYIKKEPGVRIQMRLHSMKITTGLLIDKHIVLEYMNEHDGQLTPVLVSRSFEAKSFGVIRYTRDCIKFILKVLKLKYNDNFNTTMAKGESKFKKGAFVSAKKLNGDPVLGIYEHGYDSGDECCISVEGGKKYCVKLSSTKPANEEETKIIQETIVKPRREAEKARKKALETENTVEEEDELTEEDLEEPSEEELEEAMEASETTEE